MMLATLFSIHLLATDFMEEIESSKEKKKAIIDKVWSSNESAFYTVHMTILEDGKLREHKDGIVTLFITKDLVNIDLDNLYDFIKIDVNLDKDKVYSCSLTKKSHDNCNNPYYTNAAVGDLINDIFSIGTSLLNDRDIALEKKFDKYEFAKVIEKNESFLKQYTNRFIIANMNQNNNSQQVNIQQVAIQPEEQKIIPQVVKKVQQKEIEKPQTIVDGW